MITVRTEKEAFTVKLPEKESQEAFWKVIDILRNPDEYARKPEPFCEKEIENLTEPQEKNGRNGVQRIFTYCLSGMRRICIVLREKSNHRENVQKMRP